MGYERVNYEQVEPVADGMHFLREPLETEAVGLTILEGGPEWSGQPHDHADEDHEEIYLLLDGEATVDIEGDSVSLSPGDAVRIDPDAKREIQIGDEQSRLLLVGADK